MLEKVTAALASGSHPDIAYIFGADLPSVARSPQVVDMTDGSLLVGAVDRLLAAGAGRRHGQRPRARGAGAGRLACRGVQQVPVRPGRARAARTGLDLGGLPGHGQEADRPGRRRFRHRLARRRRRGHRLAAVAAGVGPRRRDHRRGRHRHRLPAGRASGRWGWSGIGRGQASTSTRRPAASRCTRCSTRDGWAWCSPGRGSCRTSSTAGVDYTVVPMPTFDGRPVTISGPGHLDAVRQRPGPGAGRPDVRALADATRPRTCGGTSARAACR